MDCYESFIASLQVSIMGVGPVLDHVLDHVLLDIYWIDFLKHVTLIDFQCNLHLHRISSQVSVTSNRELLFLVSSVTSENSHCTTCVSTLQ